MARGRMLSTEASVDEELQSISVESMALYLLSIPHLDRDGLIDANPARLVAMAAPMRYEFRDRAAALISEWIEAGLVVRYQVSSRTNVLFFKGFRRHQQGMEYGRELASKFPPPPGWTRTKEGLIPDDPELCFRLAESFHPKSAYRRVLTVAAGADAPEDVSDTSRSVRERSRSDREEFAPKTNKEKRTVYGGGVLPNTHPHHEVDLQNTTTTTTQTGRGAGEGAPTRLTQALAEFDDDELRIAADALAHMHGLPNEYNGWARMISGATREELMLILIWCRVWDSYSPEQYERLHSIPAVLRKNVQNRMWPNPAQSLIDDLANAVEDAVFAAVPEAER